MRKSLVAFAALIFVGNGVRADDVPPAKIGTIYIVGNERTPNSEVQKLVEIHPGEFLRYPDIKAAEQKLAKSGLFVVDPEKGVRPTITVIEDTESVFKDIVVNVQQAPPEAIQPTPQPRRTGILGRLLPMRRSR